MIFILLALTPIRPGWAAEAPIEAPDPVFTVAIDPGHGGDDGGAIGPSGASEKDIVLEIAKKLVQELEQRLAFKALLTRSEDLFVPLDERTSFANRNRADIFISIHANSAPAKGVRGIETFFLSFEATDDESRRLAAFENASAASPEEASGEAGDVKAILLDLANTEAHHESARLAELVHSSVIGEAVRGNRGIKQAPFTVLVGATMPAVLVEVGFMSNPAEEKRLSSPLERARIARKIAEGIMLFRENQNPIGRSLVGIGTAPKN